MLEVFDDGATTGQTGELTTIPSGDMFGAPITVGLDQSGQGDNISGLDLPAGNQSITYTNSSTGVTTTFEGGISFVNLDAVEIFLGKGNDTFTIDTTAPTLNADDGLQSMIVVEGGGGSNTINVTASSDPLVLYGNDSGSGVEYNSAPGAITGNAYAFTNYGTGDTINASGATGTVVIVGGPANDTLTGGSGINWIAGGEGGDTIDASGTANYIFGDSSFTGGELVASPVGNSQSIDLASRLLTIDNGLLPMDAGVLSAGANTITVTGSGASTVFGAYGVIDIVGQSAGVVDPFESLGQAEVITEIASVNTALGGANAITLGNNDVVIGGAGANTIVVGAVGADVIIGANGEVNYAKGVLASVESLDPAHGGNDTITGPNGTAGGSGDSVVIGGVGADTITLGGAGNAVIGNDGQVDFDANGKLTMVETLDPGYGGSDAIKVTGGGNVILGGAGSNSINVLGASSGNIILGHDGYADFAAGVLTQIASADPTDEGYDVITLGSGDNVVIGGSGGAQIVLGALGSDIVVGDNGAANFTGGVLTSIESTDPTYGGNNTITGPTVSGKVTAGGSGGSTIIGGIGSNTIIIGGAGNTIIGHDGAATFGASGQIRRSRRKTRPMAPMT